MTQKPPPTPDVTQANKPEGQSTILNLYAVFGVSMILSVMPYAAAAVLSLIFFLGLLIAAYVVRSDAAKDSLKDNHATFIIRTLWIAAFISIPTTLAAAAYMQFNIDYTAFDPCIESLARQSASWLETAPHMEIYAFVQPCVETFLEMNKREFIMTALIAGGPVLAYMAFRFIKGLSRAIRGYRLANPRTVL